MTFGVFDPTLRTDSATAPVCATAPTTRNRPHPRIVGWVLRYPFRSFRESALVQTFQPSVAKHALIARRRSNYTMSAPRAKAIRSRAGVNATAERSGQE